MSAEQNHHNHDHAPAVDRELLKRLRFIKISMDLLAVPEMNNRDQILLAATRQLEIIGKLNANQNPAEALSGWVYTAGILDEIQADVRAVPDQTEMNHFMKRVEVYSGMPLEGREEEWKKEQELLAKMSGEQSIKGLVRFITLLRSAHITFRKVFLAAEINMIDVMVSRHLIEEDLTKWKQLNIKPHWFNDAFMTFALSEAELAELNDLEREEHLKTERDMVIRLLSVRFDTPEAVTLRVFYQKRYDDALAQLPEATEDVNETEES